MILMTKTKYFNWKKTMMKVLEPIGAAVIIQIGIILSSGSFSWELLVGGFITGLSLGWKTYLKNK